jgi:hypothetical protein
MNTQSVIVYRNPLEQQFWESGVIFPVVVGGAAFMIIVALGARLLDLLKWSHLSQKRKYAQNAILSVAAIVGIGTIGYLLQQ